MSFASTTINLYFYQKTDFTKKKIMKEKPKVYLYMQGGIIQHATSNMDIEVIRIDVDDTPGIARNIVDTVSTTKELNAEVNSDWADELKSFIGQEVNIEADNDNVHNDFTGTLEEIKQDTDGSFYATVRDQDDDAFDIDVIYVNPSLEK